MYRKSWPFDCRVSDISLSPSHTHALVALQTEGIKTYDLLNCQLSPYTIPSLWKLKDEEITQASEMLSPDLAMSYPLLQLVTNTTSDA